MGERYRELGARAAAWRARFPCACSRRQVCLSASVRTWREFLQLLSKQGEILPDILGHILTIKRRCRVITGQVLAVVVFDHTPSYLIHAVDAEQLLRGNAAKQHNQGRVNQLNLLEEVERGTRIDLTFSRCTVVFWTAFDGIGNEENAAVHTAAGQHFIQKAPGRTDERLATLVFLAARGFANEHHTCRRCTLPWHGFGSCSRQRALYTATNLCGQCFQSLGFLYGRHIFLPTTVSPESLSDETAGGIRLVEQRHCDIRMTLPCRLAFWRLVVGISHARRQLQHSDAMVPRTGLNREAKLAGDSSTTVSRIGK